ncbi:hypothetical protein HBI52_082590 [Parastagonospora nodorum]|nr:hypothetical protein HBI52_082590 [Parastagonospora nodorum]KAH6395036.1 hypothetical protein HBI60_132540 [Parastagonospora nodorum]
MMPATTPYATIWPLRDHNSPKPKMPIRPHRPATILLILHMMHVPQNRLEEQQHKQHNADDRVVRGKQVVGYVVDHPDPQGKGNDVDDVCEELEEPVDEPGAAEGRRGRREQ